MLFQLVASVNYSQKVCVKMNTVDNTRAASLDSLRIEITTKKNTRRKQNRSFKPGD